jgi:hypothetical protein
MVSKVFVWAFESAHRKLFQRQVRSREDDWKGEFFSW